MYLLVVIWIIEVILFFGSNNVGYSSISINYTGKWTLCTIKSYFSGIFNCVFVEYKFTVFILGSFFICCYYIIYVFLRWLYRVCYGNQLAILYYFLII